VIDNASGSTTAASRTSGRPRVRPDIRVEARPRAAEARLHQPVDNALERWRTTRARASGVATRRNDALQSVRIRISDTGKGFPGSTRQPLPPYFSTRKGGTGLGLAIVRQIITDHTATAGRQNTPLEPASSLICPGATETYQNKPYDASVGAHR